MNNANTRRITPELLSQMVDLLPMVGSLRDLCAITGLRLDTVRREMAPFLAIMKLQGTHPKCGCGRDRFHPYGCVDSFAKSDRSGLVNGKSRADAPLFLERRERIITMLLAGERFVDIDQALGLYPKSARKYLRFLTPEQLEQRDRLQHARGNAPRGAAEPKRPFSDPLYARIASAVPRWVTEATRDDIISEMYVAVREGVLAEADIEASAKRFATAAVAMWESRFGPRSLDERLFDDGLVTLKDMIVDPAALDAFDRIHIGATA